MGKNTCSHLTYLRGGLPGGETVLLAAGERDVAWGALLDGCGTSPVFSPLSFPHIPRTVAGSAHCWLIQIHRPPGPSTMRQGTIWRGAADRHGRGCWCVGTTLRAVWASVLSADFIKCIPLAPLIARGLCSWGRCGCGCCGTLSTDAVAGCIPKEKCHSPSH